ncbi:MAG: endonuclease/exonuclease/phosphatase family metal-dependent hydrolase/DNA [Myxococcota bacterium]|jgi:endonuclease/exonuclease/phosphatase family metal-dependent hydrolase/DNA/RNA endonuclease YhcR with UshA esterase domain
MKKLFVLVFVVLSNMLIAQEEVVQWDAVTDAHIGQDIIVQGQVVRSHNSGKATFLNFHEDWEGKFVAVIFSSTACDFVAEPADFFLGREIQFQGKVKKYKGSLEIIIDSPQDVWCTDGTQVAINPPVSGGFKVGEKYADGVRFVSWNVENLFDEHDDPYRNEGNTSTTTESRKIRIARVLNELNADVVALEEVENRGILEDFNKKYLKDLGYEVVLFEGNDKRGIDNALLTRLPINSVTSYRHSEYQDSKGVTRRFSRDLLRVSVGGDFNADVYVVHFKSQAGGAKSDVKREAEAHKALSIIQAELKANPEYRAVIAGDFNEVLEMDAAKQQLSVKYFIDAGLIDSYSGTDKYTYNQEPYQTRIDFALCTKALAADVKNGDIVNELAGINLECASDHYPVLVEFSAKPSR